MIGSCVIALVIAVLVILIIQLLTKYIVKILVIAFFLCSCFGIVYVWVGWFIKEKKRQSEFDPIQFQGFPICDGVSNSTVNIVFMCMSKHSMHIFSIIHIFLALSTNFFDLNFDLIFDPFFDLNFDLIFDLIFDQNLDLIFGPFF